LEVVIPKTSYSGKIREIKLGLDNELALGGESTLPFYLFEGEMPNKVRIAFEVYDVPPDDWPEAAMAPYREVMTDPVAWAKKYIAVHGAELICLQLASTDPAGLDRSAEEAANTAKKVAEAINVPLIVWGTTNHEKDTEVLKRVCEVCAGKHLLIGPLEEGDYKKIGAAAMAYGIRSLPPVPSISIWPNS
jgi:acetyl-CoA decarbonylase/synthase, CODH/ACS complex subunit delta